MSSPLPTASLSATSHAVTSCAASCEHTRSQVAGMYSFIFWFLSLTSFMQAQKQFSANHSSLPPYQPLPLPDPFRYFMPPPQLPLMSQPTHTSPCRFQWHPPGTPPPG